MIGHDRNHSHGLAMELLVSLYLAVICESGWAMVAGKSQGQVKPWQQKKQAQHLNSQQLHGNHHFFLKYPQERVALDNGIWMDLVHCGLLLALLMFATSH